jgi:hypothetical protein
MVCWSYAAGRSEEEVGGPRQCVGFAESFEERAHFIERLSKAEVHIGGESALIVG